MEDKDYSIIGKILVSMIKKEVENEVDNCRIFIDSINEDFELKIGIGIIKNEGKQDQRRHAFSFNFDTFYDEIEKAKYFLTK